MTDEMRAAAITEHGPADVLRAMSVPRPTPAPGEVLVQVHVAGVQVTDAAVRGGWVPPGAEIVFPQVLGNEFAGTVVEVGQGVEDVAVGTSVVGFRVLGCYAQYVAVPRTQLVTKPRAVPWTTAGALSASGQTAHTALEALGGIAGETLLVHGAAGGVGSMLVQLARNRGLRVVGTASEANHDYLRGLGAEPVTYGPGQAERIRAAAPSGIHLALDAAGHDNLRTTVDVVADRQRIATIVDMQLADELGCRWIRSDRSATRLQQLMNLCATGELTVHVRATYGLDEAALAHRDVETGHGRGKVTLLVTEAAR